MADAQTASNAPGYLPLSGGSLSGTLDANAGIKANRIGQLSFAGWNEIMRINTGSHGAIYNPYSGVFVGLDSSRAVYFGNNLEGQYYGSINANGWNGNVNGATPITAANVGSYALPLSGGSLSGSLTLNNGPQLIVNTSTLPGGYARGMFFTDKTGTNAAVTAYGVNGTNEGISIAMGSASPWSSSAGLFVTPSNITWKGQKIITTANIGSYATGAKKPSSSTFLTIWATGGSYTFPAGGMWAYWIIGVRQSAGDVYGTRAGVVPGGTTIYGWNSNYPEGFAWKISD